MKIWCTWSIVAWTYRKKWKKSNNERKKSDDAVRKDEHDSILRRLVEMRTNENKQLHATKLKLEVKNTLVIKTTEDGVNASTYKSHYEYIEDYSSWEY